MFPRKPGGRRPGTWPRREEALLTSVLFSTILQKASCTELLRCVTSGKTNQALWGARGETFGPAPLDLGHTHV